jgi:nucleotide-binding universal stress UspA family protein
LGQTPNKRVLEQAQNPSMWVAEGLMARDPHPACVARVIINPQESGKEAHAVSIFPTRILLATDGSAEAELATRHAVDLTNATGSELHIVHVALLPSFVIDGPGTVGYDRGLHEKLEEEAREVLRKLTWRVKVAGAAVVGAHLRTGKVAEEIVDLAEELQADLIVVGSRGRGGIRRTLMGSVSDSVVRHAHCPVMVVRG